MERRMIAVNGEDRIRRLEIIVGEGSMQQAMDEMMDAYDKAQNTPAMLRYYIGRMTDEAPRLAPVLAAVEQALILAAQSPDLAGAIEDEYWAIANRGIRTGPEPETIEEAST